MRRFAIVFVRERAKDRPAGYLEDVLASGRIVGEEIEFEDDQYAELLKKYRGAGDVVAAIAKPIANLLGIEDCGGCQQRQDELNKALPFT